MVSQAASLHGYISAENVLKGRLTSVGAFKGTLSKPVGYTDYSGEYEVTPKVNEQELKTKDKHMTDNVTVRAIPYFDTGNNSGGRTVYIGNEV